MKTLAAFSLATLFATGAVFAGSFGGPAPFRNDSPLPSGTDGIYNASLRGPNLSGVFRFIINGGTQSENIVNPTLAGGNYTARGNAWVAWYEGITYRGYTDAAIFDGKVAGVLDPLQPMANQRTQPAQPNRGSQNTSTPTFTINQTVAGVVGPPANQVQFNSNINATTPLITAPAINSTLMGGEFSGSIDSNSPIGSMKGKGKFVAVQDLGLISSENVAVPLSQPQYVAKVIKFRWRGARVSIAPPQ